MKKQALLTAASLCLYTAASALPAFPGAEGWGADTKGGRGGKVYVVTTLASTGPGSFNEAIQATVPRIIVFRVSGVIDTKPGSHFYLSKANGNVTIAGQTSPGGITLTSSTGGFGILHSYHGDFHNAIFRFLRFRAKENTDDGLTLNQVNNVIIDHCDFSGGSDESLDITASNDFTVQWCTIANSSKGQSYGFLMAYLPTSHVSLHHNLIANHVFRFPEMHWEEKAVPDNGKIDYRNNVVYNGERYFLYSFENTPSKNVQLNMVGNYQKAGPQTPVDWLPKMVSLGDKITGYESDNITATKAGVEDKTSVAARVPNKVTTPWVTPAVTTTTAKVAYDQVLQRAGAFPRDAMNQRTVNEVKTGTGQFAKDDDAVITGGPQAPADTDNDGMPDAWETLMGLVTNDASDNSKDHDNDGYTNIEEYINDAAASILGESIQNVVAASALPLGVLPIKTARPPRTGMRMDAAQDASGSLRITLPAGSRGGVEISDVKGRTVASFAAKEKLVWDFSNQGSNPGIYTVRWVVDGRTAQRMRVQVM